MLTRRAAAIETLGAATVLCTDKTGTLTENRMTIAELRTGEACRQASGAVRRTLVDLIERRAGQRAASRSIRWSGPSQAWRRAAGGTEASTPAWSWSASTGLRPELLAVTNVWRRRDGDELVACRQGRARGDRARSAGSTRSGSRWLHAVGGRDGGARACACWAWRGPLDPAPSCPRPQRDFAFEFLGLVGFADPLRANVPEAVRECRAAGIRVVMITGDYPATARAIAAQAGIDAERR